ncbi:MAG: DNA replication/repair protein RecF [Pseudomonadales bacterium]|nr:DNA replication/repair protein RecF [Pseudomonadales bacterium]NNL11209.1 DNA replication/repair protein RecF [Pseudomonadales bacterium]NNM11230.1 DNA replication/repair protein RecF [Pseudomonadales bacterium]RZV58197.1 MAG: DNA replication/repair protein RecF [Pseudomonadales bacterium]
MKLSTLSIHSVRNVGHAQLAQLGDINIIYGQNGAGKTTVLECIHMLALGRSFRSTALRPVIQRGQDHCVVSGRLQQKNRAPLAIGIQRERKGGFTIRIDGETVRSAVELAKILPLQLINAASYLLIEGGPKLRRQFIDWGVFHVEHRFYEEWRRMQRALKQRNAILRAGGTAQQLLPWDRELIESGEFVHNARLRYLESFCPVFQKMLAELCDLDGISLSYRAGWDKTLSFAEALKASQARDQNRGLTHVGPQRADLKIAAYTEDAGQVLSRGQQKLVVSALRLAQTHCLTEQTGAHCLLLVDDLPAEMDAEHQRRLCGLLAALDMQLFITCIDAGEIERFSWPAGRELQWFHVKQGEITALNT